MNEQPYLSETIVEPTTQLLEDKLDMDAFETMNQQNVRYGRGTIRTPDEVRKSIKVRNHEVIAAYVRGKYQNIPGIFQQAIVQFYEITGSTRTKVCEDSTRSIDKVVQQTSTIVSKLDNAAVDADYTQQDLKTEMAEKARELDSCRVYIGTATVAIKEIGDIILAKEAGREIDYDSLRTKDHFASKSVDQLKRTRNTYRNNMADYKTKQHHVETQIQEIKIRDDALDSHQKTLARARHMETKKINIALTGVTQQAPYNVDVPDAIQIEIAENDIDAAKSLGIYAQVTEACNRQTRREGAQPTADWSKFLGKPNAAVREGAKARIDEQDRLIKEEQEVQSVGIDEYIESVLNRD